MRYQVKGLAVVSLYTTTPHRVTRGTFASLHAAVRQFSPRPVSLWGRMNFNRGLALFFGFIQLSYYGLLFIAKVDFTTEYSLSGTS